MESPVKTETTQTFTLPGPKEGQQRVKLPPVAPGTKRSCFYMQNLTKSSYKHSGLSLLVQHPLSGTARLQGLSTHYRKPENRAAAQTGRHPDTPSLVSRVLQRPPKQIFQAM